ncbi:MAG: glycosyltransferase family 2 protein [Bdellovibrionales bacterium]|nr:glycosyltransferase family 2 protein [Bdellovibrionales bacterium]
MRRLSIIIPFFNETGLLQAHLQRLERFLGQHQYLQDFQTTIVLVDDGSKIKSKPGLVGKGSLVALRHLINLGQGAALQTGISYACHELQSEYFVTMDADGQHRSEDLPALLDPVVAGRSDIIFGNRFLADKVSVPSLRRWVLRGGILFEKWVTGLDLGDSHNGFRAFNRRVAERMDIQLNRMAHATEIKQIVARESFRYSEVPVQISYSAHTLAKGQRNLGALIILKDLLGAYFFRKTSGR